MKRINRRHRMIFYAFFVSFILNIGTIIANSSNSNNLIEIDQVILDINSVGIVFNDDISNYVSPGSNIYILIVLSQESVLNGLYLIGFGLNETSIITYKLGDPFDPNSVWFDKESDTNTNYGSIISFDILDYVVAFSFPDTAKAIVLSLPDSFDVIKTTIYPFINDYRDYLISGPMNQSSTISTKSKTNSINGFELNLSLLVLLVPVFLRKKNK